MAKRVSKEEFMEAAEAVWSEIEYQNSLPRRTDDEAKDIPGFCTMLRIYTQRCENDWADQPGQEQLNGQVQVPDSLNGLRKIAAIAIRAMIYNGVRFR